MPAPTAAQVLQMSTGCSDTRCEKVQLRDRETEPGQCAGRSAPTDENLSDQVCAMSKPNPPSPSPLDQPTTFTTTSTQFAAYLITDAVLQLLSWGLNAHRTVEFVFADPDARGPTLEIAFRNSRDYRLFANRQFLLEKMRGVVGFGTRGGNDAKA